MSKRSVIMAACFGAAVFTLTVPAAAITCEGNFQVQNSGARISTPYCQDDYLAQVARQYGVRADARTIRGNVSEKERVCRFIGDDNRVRDTCAPYRNDSDRPWD